MAMKPPGGLDRRAVGRGAVTYLAIAVPCGLIVAFLHGNDTTGHESNLWIAAAVAIILVAPVIAGAVAGSANLHSPLSDAAVAVGLPAGLYLVVRVASGTIQGTLTATQVVSFLLYLIVFMGLA